jgi:hypothetical protein
MLRRQLGLAVLCISIALGVAGCAQRWAKPGGTQEEFNAMKSPCASRAYSRFPPMMRQVQLTVGYTTPVTTQRVRLLVHLLSNRRPVSTASVYGAR